jgi:diguanylate cyclase (GGDEF)-like protein
MTSSISEEAIQALRRYLEAESTRDLEATMALVGPLHCGFGTGPDEIVRDADHLRELLTRQFAQATESLRYDLDILRTLELGPDVCVVQAILTMHARVAVGHETLSIRMTFVMHRTPGGWRLPHLHASMPWSLQQEGESFPLQAIDARNRRLEHLVAERTQELERTLELVQRLATIDKLTGVHNRAKIDEILADEHRVLQRHPRASALALLDLDHFKSINDRLGHLVGDRVLHDVAEELGHSVREVDRVGRWGGEEFLVLLPEATAAGARLVAERIQHRLAARDFGTGRPVTVSVGIAQYRAGESVDDWLARADTMLYLAKERGRNRIEVDV